MSITASAIFEGLNAMAQIGMALSVATGVGVAYHQLKATREEVPRRRRSELAEEIIVLASQAEDAFRHMRNPFDSIPQEKISDKEFVYRKRYERIVEANDLFKSLRDTQVRLEAIAPCIDISKNVSELILARSEIAYAIEELIEFSDRGAASEYRDEIKNARTILYGRWSDKDALGLKILENVKQIKDTARTVAGFGEGA